MEEKLYYQTIEIDGYGTTDIMKWLQANHQLALYLGTDGKLYDCNKQLV